MTPESQKESAMLTLWSPQSALHAVSLGDLSRAETIIKKGLKDRPDDLQWIRCQIELLSRQGCFTHAHALTEQLLQRGVQDPALLHTFARLKVSLGAFQEGVAILDRLRPHGIFGDPPIKTSTPLWQGESLSGKSICVATEGGVGDVVCFARFALDLARRGAKVIVATYPPLFQLLKTIPGIQFLIDREATDKVSFDLWIPALSLPWLLKLKSVDIRGKSYMQVDPKIRQKWRYLVTDPRPRVGLCWQGRKEFVEDNLRSISASLISPLLESSSVAWYKTQLFEGGNTLQHPNLIDLTSHLTCPDQLAGLISNLDLLITVDTGPAHIAGALGTPVWLLNRFFGWITFSGPNPHLKTPEDGLTKINLQSHWYDSMDIYTQTRFGQWAEPLYAVQKNIERWAEEFESKQRCKKTFRSLNDLLSKGPFHGTASTEIS
jgi:hypothetical protein